MNRRSLLAALFLAPIAPAAAKAAPKGALATVRGFARGGPLSSGLVTTLNGRPVMWVGEDGPELENMPAVSLKVDLTAIERAAKQTADLVKRWDDHGLPPRAMGWFNG